MSSGALTLSVPRMIRPGEIGRPGVRVRRENAAQIAVTADMRLALPRDGPAGERLGPAEHELLRQLPAGAERLEERLSAAVGEPGLGAAQIQKGHPIVIERTLARLGTALQPFVGALDAERGALVHLPERRRQLLARRAAERRRGKAKLAVELSDQGRALTGHPLGVSSSAGFHHSFQGETNNSRRFPPDTVGATPDGRYRSRPLGMKAAVPGPSTTVAGRAVRGQGRRRAGLGRTETGADQKRPAEQ